MHVRHRRDIADLHDTRPRRLNVDVESDRQPRLCDVDELFDRISLHLVRISIQFNLVPHVQRRQDLQGGEPYRHAPGFKGDRQLPVFQTRQVRRLVDDGICQLKKTPCRDTRIESPAAAYHVEGGSEGAQRQEFVKRRLRKYPGQLGRDGRRARRCGPLQQRVQTRKSRCSKHGERIRGEGDRNLTSAKCEMSLS